MHIPLVIAHRGDPSEALENSLEAIHHALRLPADMIELDIRKSRDNVLYVMHDLLTGRTAEKNINIERALSDEIGRIKLKNGESIPTLTDVIKAVSGAAGLNLEIKSDGAGLITAQYLASSDYTGYVLVSSFKEAEVMAFRQVLHALPTSLIFDVFSIRDVVKYKQQGHAIISLRKNTVTEKLLAACGEQGIQVYVWTVDEEDEMQKFISWGVDGIYSNKPGLLRKWVRKAQQEARSE